MDQYSRDYPVSKSPRNNLQGPRPTPLKLSKDSHKIVKKPPVLPQQANSHQQIRPPVIIYTVSPKVIHTSPGHFMDLVQRLTGSNSSNLNQINNNNFGNCGAISPVARYASVHKVNMSPKLESTRRLSIQREEEEENLMNLDEPSQNLFPGILSPGPNMLPPISANMFFPPPTESQHPNMSNSVSLFHDLSPVFHGNRNFIEGSFMPSPSSRFVSPHIVSPNIPSLDLFNNFSDF
jgi:hypothetical protein